MNDTDCAKCKHNLFCDEPFPVYKCERFEEKIYDWEIIKLYKGMSPEMQKQIYELMKLTQQSH